MSLVYTGTSGLFTTLGTAINAVNTATNSIDDWTAVEIEVQAIYDAALQHDSQASLIDTINGIESNLANLRTSFSAICDARLQDYTTVVAPLALAQNDVNSILYALIYQMTTDAASINASVVTIGSVTAGVSNIGNGTILIDGTLDGFSSPAGGASPHPLYLGKLSEFPMTETVTIRCAADSYADGATASQEQFGINGQLPISGKWGVGTEGSSVGPSFSTLQAGAILQNMGFESFSVTDTPDSWTISAGVVTTNVKQETPAGANVYLGTSSVKLLGTGVAAITITQPISVNNVDPLRRYCCSIRYKASAAEGAGGKTFSVQLTGTGYSAGSTEKISIAGTALPTSWTLGYFFVNLPAVIPSDFALTISLSGTPTVNVWVDSLGFDAATWHGGLAYAIAAGSTNFAKYDVFSAAIANSHEGVFQYFAIRNYLVQLPSKADGTETINDVLAS